MIPAYNKKRCAAVPFETGIYFRRKTDFFPEENTTTSYSGFEPEPIRLQAEGKAFSYPFLQNAKQRFAGKGLHSAMVEHSTPGREVPGSNPGAVDTRRYSRVENRVWSDQERHEERGSKDRTASTCEPHSDSFNNTSRRRRRNFVPQTISRHFAEANLKYKRPFRALPLTPEHRQLRLQWCQARSMWNVTDWQKVVFSDESRFVLGTEDNRVRVWRCHAYYSRSTLIVMRGTLTGQRYVEDILRPHVGCFLNGLPGAIIQQDNARPHSARVAQASYVIFRLYLSLLAPPTCPL
ncbi:transposable element Tcb2 transposase [Trichonephila clavipes]|nr:transposable element Tcb2 transposase [Trichonephila clavipes]